MAFTEKRASFLNVTINFFICFSSLIPIHPCDGSNFFSNQSPHQSPCPSQCLWPFSFAAVVDLKSGSKIWIWICTFSRSIFCFDLLVDTCFPSICTILFAAIVCPVPPFHLTQPINTCAHLWSLLVLSSLPLTFAPADFMVLCFTGQVVLLLPCILSVERRQILVG